MKKYSLKTFYEKHMLRQSKKKSLKKVFDWNLLNFIFISFDIKVKFFHKTLLFRNNVSTVKYFVLVIKSIIYKNWRKIKNAVNRKTLV